MINVFERRFGPSPIDRDSREYRVHLDQMNYINEHSELNPRLDSILTPRLMQTAHGDQRHPHHAYQ